MRPHNAALADYLAANDQAVQADLYTFQLVDGETFRFSGYTKELTLPSVAFQAGSLNYGAPQTFALGPRFGRSKVTTKVGIEVTELDIDILAGASDAIGSFSLADAFRVGLFDGATVELDRFFMPSGGDGYRGALDTSLGTIIWFYGRVAEVDVGRSKVSLKVKSLLDILSIHQFPSRMYESACGHVYGDPMCGYDRVNGRNALGAATGVGAVSFAATAGSSQYQINQASGITTQWLQGTLIATSGLNNGQKRTIYGVSGAALQLLKPFLFPVNTDDTFQALPGCDHTTTTCDNVFKNILRYGGFPYIPPPELAF